MEHQGDVGTPDERESLQEMLKEVREHAAEAVRKLDEVGEGIERAGKAKHHDEDRIRLTRDLPDADQSIEIIDRGGLDRGYPRGGPKADDLPYVEAIDVGEYDTGHPGGGPK